MNSGMLLVLSTALLSAEPVAEHASPEEFRQFVASDLTRTESGLRYQVLKQTKGQCPGRWDTVKIRQSLYLPDGTRITDRNTKPLQELCVVETFAGYAEGLQLMPEGAKYRFKIPPHLAYGEYEDENIPANATLVVDIELLGVCKSGIPHEAYVTNGRFVLPLVIQRFDNGETVQLHVEPDGSFTFAKYRLKDGKAVGERSEGKLSPSSIAQLGAVLAKTDPLSLPRKIEGTVMPGQDEKLVSTTMGLHNHFFLAKYARGDLGEDSPEKELQRYRTIIDAACQAAEGAMDLVQHEPPSRDEPAVGYPVPMPPRPAYPDIPKR